jgi:hypothetical protein
MANPPHYGRCVRGWHGPPPSTSLSIDAVTVERGFVSRSRAIARNAGRGAHPAAVAIDRHSSSSAVARSPPPTAAMSPTAAPRSLRIS